MTTNGQGADAAEVSPKAGFEPVSIALAAAALGCCMVVAGVFVLFGLGWALIAGAAPLFGFAALVLRGMTNGG